MPSSRYFDLVAQRAASLARIEDMKRDIETATGIEFETLRGMLAQYEKAMPGIDAQIARFA